jgi:hypothetical protein
LQEATEAKHNAIKTNSRPGKEQSSTQEQLSPPPPYSKDKTTARL